MKFLKLLLLAALLGGFFIGSANAQWQVPQNSIPAGTGAGTGFNPIGPGTNNQALFGNTGSAPTFRQPTPGDFPSIANGHLIANGSGGGASPADTAPATWFDQAWCSTVGYIVTRLTGGWACAQSIPADVTWWGAVCNGSTDDYTAIKNAIAALPAGATLKFPATSCAVKTLTAGGTNPHIFVLTQAIHIWFPSGGGILKSGVIGILFDIQTSFVTIDGTPNTVIDGGWSGTAYSAYDIAVSTNDYATTNTNRAYVRIYGIQFTNWAMGGIMLGYCNICDVSGNTINNVAYAAIFCNCQQFQITGNHVINVWSSTGPDQPGNPVYRANHYGIAASYFTTDFLPLYGAVAGNTVANVPAWECYDSHAGQNLIFSNNVGINCNTGIAISSPAPSVATDITINNNQIVCIALGSPVYNGSTGQSVGGAGISAVGQSSTNLSARLVISGNIMNGCGPDNTTLEGNIGNIYVTLFAGAVISSNVIYNPRYAGIAIGDYVSGDIKNNVMQNLVNGPVGASVGLQWTGANNNTNVGGQWVSGTYTDGYIINSGNTIAISRDNVFSGYTTLHAGAGSYTDLGTSAP